MELPELYRYGREGYWFNFKTFSLYMFDGVVQVSCSNVPRGSHSPFLVVCDHLFLDSVRLLLSDRKG